jgi:aldehyde dehydrogenase (NAD+)
MAPWNYPVQLALMPIVGAVAAGNCVLLRPGEYTTNTSATLQRLLEKYMDNDAVATVTGDRYVTSACLDERFDHIFFTGGKFVGGLVAAAAAKFLTPVTLELGGQSPTIVDKHTDVVVAARRIAWGAMMNAGRRFSFFFVLFWSATLASVNHYLLAFASKLSLSIHSFLPSFLSYTYLFLPETCVRPNHVFVHAAVGDAFVVECKKAVLEFYGKDATKTEFFGRIVNARAYKRVAALLADSKAQIVCGGVTDGGDNFVAPTLLDFGSDVAAFSSSKVMQEEIFGPLLPIVRFNTLDEVLPIINGGAKPLALYIFSTDSAFVEKVMRVTSSGGVCVNDVLMHLTNQVRLITLASVNHYSRSLLSIINHARFCQSLITLASVKHYLPCLCYQTLSLCSFLPLSPSFYLT